MRSILSSGLVLATLTIFSHTVQAQYVWIDAQGHKQYSDTPPPPSVSQKNILKSSQAGSTSSTSGGDTDSGSATDSKPAASIQSRNEDFNKRRAEQAEKDKKASEAAQQADAKAKNCERLRSYSRNLSSGVRMANTDANGERNYMSDEQRQKELSEANKNLQNCAQ